MRAGDESESETQRQEGDRAGGDRSSGGSPGPACERTRTVPRQNTSAAASVSTSIVPPGRSIRAARASSRSGSPPMPMFPSASST